MKLILFTFLLLLDVPAVNSSVQIIELETILVEFRTNKREEIEVVDKSSLNLE